MQFGVHLPHIGPWYDGDTLRRFAGAAEEMGYDSVWASDHIVFPLGFQSRYPYAEGGQFPLPPVVPWLEPVTTLTFVAGATSRLKLGTSILVLPYRNPVLNAKQLANLQTVSGGRLIVGAAERGGRRLIVSVLGSSDVYKDAITLLEWAFANAPSACREQGVSAGGQPGD